MVEGERKERRVRQRREGEGDGKGVERGGGAGESQYAEGELLGPPPPGRHRTEILL